MQLIKQLESTIDFPTQPLIYAIWDSKWQNPPAKCFKCFGSSFFVQIPKKMSGSYPKAYNGILLGCLPQEMYRVLAENGDIIESKHVRIDDSIYYGREFLNKLNISYEKTILALILKLAMAHYRKTLMIH